MMIVAIFVVTGFRGAVVDFGAVSRIILTASDVSTGPSFWDQGILTVVGLNKNEWISKRVPNVGLNVAFMIFGAAALAFNIVTR